MFVVVVDWRWGGRSRAGDEEYIVSKMIRMMIADDNVLDDEPWEQKKNHASRRPCQDRYILSDYSRDNLIRSKKDGEKKVTEQGGRSRTG